MSAGDCSIELQRFAGPVAEEIAILCRPRGSSRDPGTQAEAAYRALAEALAASGGGASCADLAAETLFLRDVRRDLPPVLETRSRVLADVGQAATAPLPAFIQHAPADESAIFELAASAVVPRDRGAWSVRDVQAEPACPCDGCARSGARVMRFGDQSSAWSANLYGAGGDVRAQALAMFAAAERLLAACGMGFRDVVRTWIQLRHIDRDYDAFNGARREFFAARGVEPRPASTGVEGAPFPVEHDVALSVQALRSDRPLDARRMSTPRLNEAWTYGADFSRGLRVVEANKIALHVSGTASIDERGGSVHPGGVEAQAERMLDNVESLLAGQGASFASLQSAVAYLRRASDAAIVRNVFRRRGFAGFPCAVVEAALCRAELLCEVEAAALLPPAVATA